MKIILASSGDEIKVDDRDYKYLKDFVWSVYRAAGTGTKYAVRYENYQPIIMHRVIANTPDGWITDHINHDGLDNRRENIRICTHEQNMQNKNIYKNNKSGYKGVVKRGNGWIAKLTHNKRRIYLGYYSDKTDAARAYDKGAKKYFGQFAKLNLSE